MSTTLFSGIWQIRLSFIHCGKKYSRNNKTTKWPTTELFPPFSYSSTPIQALRPTSFPNRRVQDFPRLRRLLWRVNAADPLQCISTPFLPAAGTGDTGDSWDSWDDANVVTKICQFLSSDPGILTIISWCSCKRSPHSRHVMATFGRWYFEGGSLYCHCTFYRRVVKSQQLPSAGWCRFQAALNKLHRSGTCCPFSDHWDPVPQLVTD